MAAKKRIRTPAEGLHGYGPYGNGCRCDVCKEANRKRRAEHRRPWQERLKAAKVAGIVNVVDGIKHGIGGYCNFCCRCDVCVGARNRAIHQEPESPISDAGSTVVQRP